MAKTSNNDPEEERKKRIAAKLEKITRERLAMPDPPKSRDLPKTGTPTRPAPKDQAKPAEPTVTIPASVSAPARSLPPLPEPAPAPTRVLPPIPAPAPVPARMIPAPTTAAIPERSLPAAPSSFPVPARSLPATPSAAPVPARSLPSWNDPVFRPKREDRRLPEAAHSPIAPDRAKHEPHRSLPIDTPDAPRRSPLAALGQDRKDMRDLIKGLQDLTEEMKETRKSGRTESKRHETPKSIFPRPSPPRAQP